MVPLERNVRSGSIAFSGGGYRAMLYGLGVAWRLHELGVLCRAQGHFFRYPVALFSPPTLGCIGETFAPLGSTWAISEVS